MNKTQIINHKINKEMEGTYYTIPFIVPDGIERISVSYTYSRFSGRTGKFEKTKNVIDLGLMDQNGFFIGWSGSSKQTVFTGAYSSTPGYLMAEIQRGEWFIIVGAYKIPDGGLDVCYEIEFTIRQPRWLAGDLHVHSNASDGQYDTAALAKKAKKAGLDFFAVSNHNNYSDNLYLPVVPDLTILPAVEWTHYKGHFNFFGVAVPFENSFIANSEEEMLALIKSAKEKGALISVNHPKCTICPYLWNNDDCFDLVEVWNGPMRTVNMNALFWWHELLQIGKKIPVIGGSDYHRDLHSVRLGFPVTRVFSSSPAVNDILSAVKNGHCYITSSVGGAVLGLNCEEAMMGDSVIWHEGLELSVSTEGARLGSMLKLITSSGVAAEWKRFPGGKLETNVSVPDTWRFAYLVLSIKIFGREYARAISNPVYFE